MNKKTLKNLIGICALAALTGCMTSTGLTFVDYDTAEKSNLVVTNFTDNSLYATIDYDYSRIVDFNPSNMTVTLVRYVVPEKDWWTGNLTNYNDRQISLQRRLVDLTTVEEKPIIWFSDRPAIIKENIPGHLKILSIDDIGAYQLKYQK